MISEIMKNRSVFYEFQMSSKLHSCRQIHCRMCLIALMKLRFYDAIDKISNFKRNTTYCPLVFVKAHHMPHVDLVQGHIRYEILELSFSLDFS